MCPIYTDPPSPRPKHGCSVAAQESTGGLYGTYGIASRRRASVWRGARGEGSASETDLPTSRSCRNVSTGQNVTAAKLPPLCATGGG